MKAEMGIMRTAMTKAGILFDDVSNQLKPKEQAVNGKQKDKFAGTAMKNNRPYKVAQRSMVHVLHN